MTHEPLTHWPSLNDLALDALILFLSVLAALFYVGLRGVMLGMPPKFVLRVAPMIMLRLSPKPLLELTLYMVALDSTRHDLHTPICAAYVVWIFFGKNIPWDKLKKKLGSTISSLTEVAKASLQRQQSEAFS